MKKHPGPRCWRFPFDLWLAAMVLTASTCGDDDQNDGPSVDAAVDAEIEGLAEAGDVPTGHDCDTACYLAYLEGNITCEDEYQSCAAGCDGEVTCLNGCAGPRATCVLGYLGTFYDCAQGCDDCIKAYYAEVARCEEEYPEGSMREGCMDGAMSDMVDCLGWDAVCFETVETEYGSCLAGCQTDALCHSGCRETWYDRQRGCLQE
ncbi:MAG: hypothetical protein JW797_14690 [Bradymonadales bacterium]|nr:hypothetical protein [Bradymonadales bacterium]